MGATCGARRGAVHALAMFGLLAGGAAQAQVRCASPADQAAFEVGALKSEMIVLAETCPNADKTYNAFIERYRPELTSEDRVVNAWFKKTFGKVAQREYDSYITNLINGQSQIGLRQGSNFCPRSEVIFSEAMALPDATVLAQYAAGKDLVPAELGSCTVPPPLPAATKSRPKKGR